MTSDNCTLPYTNIADLSPFPFEDPGLQPACLIHFPATKWIWGLVGFLFGVCALEGAWLLLDARRTRAKHDVVVRLALLTFASCSLTALGALEASADTPGQHSIGIDWAASLLFWLSVPPIWITVVFQQYLTFRTNAEILGTAGGVASSLPVSMRFQLGLSFFQAFTPLFMLVPGTPYTAQLGLGRALYIIALFLQIIGAIVYDGELRQLLAFINDVTKKPNVDVRVLVAQTRLTQSRYIMLAQLIPNGIFDVVFAMYVTLSAYVLALIFLLAAPAILFFIWKVRFPPRVYRTTTSKSRSAADLLDTAATQGVVIATAGTMP